MKQFSFYGREERSNPLLKSGWMEPRSAFSVMCDSDCQGISKRSACTKGTLAEVRFHSSISRHEEA